LDHLDNSCVRIVGEISPFHQLLGNGPDKVVGEIAC
jgi:hypothetical protein